MNKKILLSVVISLAVGFSNLSFGQVSGYAFAQAAGTPTLLTAAYTQHTSGTTDYATYTAIPIGFTFCYNGVNYTTVSIANDGYIVMGNTIWGTTTPISSASEYRVIAALAGDLVGLAGASLRSKTVGAAGSRTFTVEWKNYARWSNGGDMTFQIILYETSNKIDIVYTTATALTTASSFQTGLSGATNADFNNRTKAAAANWIASTAGATNAVLMNVNTTLSRHPSGILTWTPPAACAGAPAAGTATSPGAVCSGVSFNIPLTGYTTGCGMSYQWQSASAIGGPYSDIAGATSTTYTGTQVATTYYRCISTCSNGGPFTATSTIATVTMNAPTACYCTSAATSTADLDIFNVTFGTINNTTADINLTGTQGNATGTAGMYSNWSASAVPVPSLEQGVNYPFATTIGGGSWSHMVVVYIDYNQDGDFVDAGENTTVFPYASATMPNVIASSITIPGTATLGNTRMRVVCVESSTNTPCGTYTWGETEDYTINITAASPMAYASCTTTQANVTAVTTGSTAQEIIGIRIVTTGSTAPLSVTQFTVNANGSTAIADVNGATAKIYSTGSSSTFATTTLFGGTIPTIANFNINGSTTLVNGTNYFWLVYDIAVGATVGDVVDAQCTSLNVGGARVPTVTAPAGSRPIVNQVTIGTGTSTGSYPFYCGWGYTRSASLFTAAEVGIPAVLTQLAWNVSTAVATVIPVKIYLKTTTATDLTADTWANMIAGATLVYTGNVTYTPTGWKTINITDFSYCADNLLVLCEANYGGTGNFTSPSFYYTATGNQAHETWSADTSPPVGNGSTGTSRPNIRIDRTPAVVTIPNCATYLTPANGAVGITCGANALLTWSPSITGCNPPSSYDVYFGTVAAPPFVVNQTGTMYNPGALLPSTTYYWKIAPKNSAGTAVCATVWSFTTGATFNVSQTTPPIIDGFENCMDWTIVNGAQVNKWINGTATFNTGTKSMYINNTATNNNYAHTASVVHFYKDITFPAGNNDFDLKFYWKGEGESAIDYLQVFLAPTSITPVAGTQVSSTYSITPFVYSLSGVGVWQYYSNKLPLACGGGETKRLIFSWRNDGSVGAQPPSAVDDIQVIMTPRTGTTCANPVNVTLPYTKTGETTACMVDDYTNASTASCGSSYESGEDKVYKVLVGAAGCMNIALTNASSTSIGFQLYNGCPDALGTTCVFNTTTGASGGVLSSDVNIPAPGFYYLVVDNWAAPANVNYDIAISVPGGNTAYDPCTGAIPLTLGISAAGDNTCTSAIGEPAAPACWTTGVMNTIWFVVPIPASRDIVVKTTNGSLLKTQMDVYVGNSCAGLTYVDCNQDAASCGTSYDHSYLNLQNLPAGANLYIRVDGENNLVGTFSILTMDGNNNPTPVLPPLVGQDCGAVLTSTNAICGQTTSVGNPGLFAYGNICDFTGAGICLASGEKSSVWYTININANGTLAFDIVPNDYGNPNPLTGQVNPSWTTAGDETDYDWALWRWEPTCDGLADNTFCCTEIAAGTTAATRCNYGSLGVTGMFTTAGTTNPAYPGFGSAYEANLAVNNGEIYVLAISNFANDYVSGYTLQFSGTSPIAYSVPGATMNWSSSTSTNWGLAGNWGGCGPPNCGINGVINAGGAQPVLSANATVKDLTINAGATLTINAGVTLTICGNLTNLGTLIAAPTSTILFNNAAVTHNVSGNLTGANKLGNLTINKTGGSVLLACNLDIGGNFTTQNTTSILNVANFYLKVGGNFSTAAAATIINCPTIEFNGTIPETYTNSSGTLTFPNVVMNNTGGGLILTGTATSNLYVSTALTLTNGIIYTANPPLLVMNAGSTSTSGSALSFVDGPMQKIGNTAFSFPTGDAFNRWMRIDIAAPSAASTFQAQYFYTPYSSLTPMAAAPTPVLNNVSAVEYWQLDRVAGAGNAQVTLHWQNASSSGINSCAVLQGGDLCVGHWTGAAWENASTVIAGVGSVTGTCTIGGIGTVSSNVNWNSFSPFTFSSKSPLVNPLPVELLSFTGKNNEKENVLEWVTASELNNESFKLERGTDGYSFKEIDAVKGAGNSSVIKNYKIIDTNPINGINYYRLKQVDFDGTVKYAPNVVALKNEREIDYSLYPNPVNNELVILADLMNQENIYITITDVSGRKVMEQKQFTIGAGSAVSIDASKLPDGVYFVILHRENSDIISQKKFVKMK